VRVSAVRFSRNFGSHAAIACGLHRAHGACAAVLAADLQDPPEVVLRLLEEWRAGAHVVWAVRAGRRGERASTLLFARLYYALMRNMVGIREMPAEGADFFLLDRRVVDALGAFPESNASLLALITWMGYRQASVEYVKQARLYGRSKWNLEKKLKLAIDSITSFSYLPIRLMSYVGFLAAVLGFAYAAVVIVNVIAGRPIEGWSSLMVVVLMMSGVQMLMLGVLGEYLWRALDESRRRPPYLVEEFLSAAGKE
ncbi:MAG TPA: glycosyltransferase, partial [Anaerolineales bacterium]|nr:glycosyltransferase [Anaerolineales bacterium]